MWQIESLFQEKKDTDVTQDKSLLCNMVVKNTFKKTPFSEGKRGAMCYFSCAYVYLCGSGSMLCCSAVFVS